MCLTTASARPFKRNVYRILYLTNKYLRLIRNICFYAFMDRFFFRKWMRQRIACENTVNVWCLFFISFLSLDKPKISSRFICCFIFLLFYSGVIQAWLWRCLLCERLSDFSSFVLDFAGGALTLMRANFSIADRRLLREMLTKICSI